MYVKAEKVVVGGDSELTEYTEIANLSFAPAADLAGASIPINEIEVDIHTEDVVEIGGYAYLYDDNDVLWASYWIVYAEHIDVNTLRLRAQSDVALLDRVKLPAVYYDEADLNDVLDETIVANSGAVGIVAPMDYTLDDSFDGETVTGFCPEQTARERLMWICFTIGAFVKSWFNEHLEILPIDDTQTLIPMSDTYWRPSVTFNDWVTAVRAKVYSFTEGTPQTTDKYVKDDNGTVYIVQETDFTLQNLLAPRAAPENIVTIEGVYLINDNNVSGILTHLSQWYFKRTEVDADVINNGSYLPGDRVAVCVDDANMYGGYINSADFTFGLQAKAKIHMTAAEDVESANLTILYMYEETQLDKKTYLLPVGYAYVIQNPYIDSTMNEHRYIFRPEDENATGTIIDGENEDTEEYAVALDLYEGILDVISVDEVTEETDEITIGVIA